MKKGILFQFIVFFVLISCAKEKPDVQPDFTYSVNDVLFSRMTISTSAEGVGGQSSDDPSLVLAGNENLTYKIQKVSGNKLFVPYLKGLELKLLGDYQVIFGFTPRLITGYVILSEFQKSSLPIVAQQIISTKEEHQELLDRAKEKINLNLLSDSDLLLPIVQIPVLASGKFRHRENDVGEKTKHLELIPSSFEVATHLHIAHSNERSAVKLSSRSDLEQTFLSRSLHGKVRSYQQISSQLNIKLRLADKQEELLTEVIGKSLSIYRVLNVADLSSAQQAELARQGSALVKECSAEVFAEQTTVPTQAECALVLSFTVPIEVIVVERELDAEGDLTGELVTRIPLEGEDDDRLVQIPQGVEVVEVFPDQILEQNDMNRVLNVANLKGQEFLFRRTLQDSPNSFRFTFAGLAGDLEIVKFEFLDDSVQVVKADALLEGGGNSPIDKEVIMEVSAKYYIRSNTDSNGNELPYETLVEVAKDHQGAIALVDWTSNFIPNVSSPLSYYGLESCFDGARSRSIGGVDHRLDGDGMLNFTQTVTYAGSKIVDCAGIRFAGYFDRVQSVFTFKERFSFMKYEAPAVEEPDLDLPYVAQKKLGFGLFTYNKKSPTENGETGFEGTEVSLPAVFDLKRTPTIRYVLAGLPKLEEAKSQADALKIQSIRDEITRATEEVIADLNRAMSQAFTGTNIGVDPNVFQLVMEEDLEQGQLGDLDVNYIYYIQKATETPIIGLGGSHSNPRSGAVESASVFLYGGNMLQAVSSLKRRAAAQRLYDNMTMPIPLAPTPEGEVEELREDSTFQLTEAVSARDSRETEGEVQLELTPKESLQLSHADLNFIKEVAQDMRSLPLIDQSLEAHDLERLSSKKGIDLYKGVKAARAKSLFSSNPSQKKVFSNEKLKFQFNESFGIADSYPEWIKSNVQASHICLREFDISSMNARFGGEDELEDVQLLAMMWKSTLAHEIGHNLGLRHNFVGSYDRANWSFYPEEESVRNYSSIMDYMVDDHFTYDGLGPYDVAALRAGYGKLLEIAGVAIDSITEVDGQRVLPLSNGALMPVHGTHFIRIDEIPNALGTDSWLDLAQTDIFRILPIKEYAFCSDEDVLYTPLCNRFDSGSTPMEIVENTIQQYNSLYSYVNFPNNRIKFGLERTGGYIGRLFSMFLPMRQFLEESIYQLIVGGDFDTLVMPQLQAALRAMDFFHDVIKTPDASVNRVIEAGVVGGDLLSPIDRFAELPVNTNQGPILLRAETKWLQDIALSGDPSRLRVFGTEFDKVIALIMLTERNFGFPRYESASLRIAYPDIERLVFDVPSPDQLPTIALLNDILKDQVEPRSMTPLGSLGLGAEFKASTTEMMRLYAILGSVMFLDVDGLEASDNNSIHFRIFNQLEELDENIPYMMRIGATDDLRYWANEDNLVSRQHIEAGDGMRQLFLQKDLYQQLVKDRFAVIQELPEGEIPSENLELQAIEAEVDALLSTMPDTVGAKSAAEVFEMLDQVEMIAANVAPRPGQSPREFALELEALGNQIESIAVSSPSIGMALDAYTVREIPELNPMIDQIKASRMTESNYGTLFRNVEISSEIFRDLHPEYFR